MPKDSFKRSTGSWRYVLQCDRDLPSSEQSVFVLKPLTLAERERVVDEVTQREFLPDGTVRTVSRMRSVAMQLALSHIESVERFPSSNPIAWPNGKGGPDARAKYLEMLSDDNVFELGNEIYTRSALGEEETKTVGESLPPAPTSS